MSKLTGILLHNFQSIKGRVFINLDKLCFLYGPNSAGKSSILDATSLLRKIIGAEENKYRAEYLFSKESNDLECSVGIEYIAKRFGYIEDGERGDWLASPDQHGDYLHEHFFNQISGKRIQVEFGSDGMTFKIAVDGIPLFDLLPGMQSYDDFYRPIDGSESEPTYDEVCGQLRIHKETFAKLLPDIYIDQLFKCSENDGETKHSDFITSHFYDLFVTDNKDTLVLRGIIFNLDHWMGLKYISTDDNFESIVFAKYETLQKHRPGDLKYQKFIDHHFSPQEKRSAHVSARHRFYWKFSEIALDLRKIIQGLFYQITDALDFEHVRGDRQLLKSSTCLSYPKSAYLNLSNDGGTYNDHKPATMYAKYLSSPRDCLTLDAPNLNWDFPNKCLKNYLISLRGYELYTITGAFQNISTDERGSSDELRDGLFVYIRLKNRQKKGLGFEDVGSGISYLFPILVALWAKELSFVEQPELHLHPAAQCELGDVFISAYNGGSSAVIESHSEHLLLRVLRRIRETNKDYLLPKELRFSHSNLRIYYFKPEKNGYTSVKEIRVDRHGEFLNSWPDGFFSERDRELFDE